MNQPDYALVLGNKNYSSWSLRPWLALRAFAVPFREINVDIYSPGARARILEHSPSGMVPALKVGGTTIWDSLAIMEYLAEAHPDIPLWPREREVRAVARAICAEMHSGFTALRREMPMAFLHSKPAEKVSDGVSRDVRRIVDIWRMCRTRFGGGDDHLFGAFSAADAFYAPVASRLRTYGVDLAANGDDGTAARYCDTVLSGPAIEEWAEGAKAQLAGRGEAY